MERIYFLRPSADARSLWGMMKKQNASVSLIVLLTFLRSIHYKDVQTSRKQIVNENVRHEV